MIPYDIWSLPGQNLSFTNSIHSAPETYTSAGDEPLEDLNVVEDRWLYDVTAPVPEFQRPTTGISSTTSSETIIPPPSTERIPKEIRYTTSRYTAE